MSLNIGFTCFCVFCVASSVSSLGIRMPQLPAPEAPHGPHSADRPRAGYRRAGSAVDKDAMSHDDVGTWT